MKKVLINFCFIILSSLAFSQTVLLEEDFEGTNSFSTSGTINWGVNTAHKLSGLNSFSINQVNIGDSALLTSQVINTTNYSNLLLEFNHICKIEFLDEAIIEVSTDNGLSWTKLNSTQYKSFSNFAIIGNRFTSAAYNQWQPGNNFANPDSSWWRNEVFDLSNVAVGYSQVKIRFKYKDANNTLQTGFNAWIIDDIKIIASNNELVPPSIFEDIDNPYGTIYNSGPFLVKADIIDSNSVSNVKLVYSIDNSFFDTVQMINTINNSYEAFIPPIGFAKSINYKIIAIDTFNNERIKLINGYNFKTEKKLNEIVIGSNGLSSSNSPISVNSPSSSDKYSQHISLLKQSEIVIPGNIKKIAWRKNNTNSYSGSDAKLRIYLKHTSNNTVNSTINFNNETNNATLVYEDTALSIASDTSWYEFHFNKSHFNFNGNDNVLVLVDWHWPSSMASGNISWATHSTNNSAITFLGASSNPTTFTDNDKRPQTKLFLEDSVYNFDAAITKITNPTDVIEVSQNNFEVVLTNKGAQNLTKATIKWQVNNSQQADYTWTGSLATDISSPPINIGAPSLNLGQNHLKVWSVLPNDSIDLNNSNDTLEMNFFVCTEVLNGYYTLGNPTSDFVDFTSLFNALYNCGISDTTIIQIESGVYEEDIIILDSIYGLTQNSPLIFTSITKNKNDVSIKGKISLEGVDFITFRHISVKSQVEAFELNNKAQFILIENCYIEGTEPVSSSYFHTIQFNGGNNNNNKILDNEIVGGYYGISFAATSQSVDSGNIIVNNKINGFFRHGIAVNHATNITIAYNELISVQPTTAPNYIAFDLSNINGDALIYNNIVDFTISAATYGIYLDNCSGNSDSTFMVYNNMVSLNGSSTSNSLRAMYINNCNNIGIYYNSLSNNIIGSSTEAFYIAGSSSNLNIRNNIFAHRGGGYAVEYTSSVNYNNFINDYNNYYSSGGQYAKIGTNIINNSSGISGLYSFYNLDSNSVLSNPNYYSFNNLHSYSNTLNNAGIHIPQITTDIDGESRNINTPDIGVDEFDIIANDAGIIGIISPANLETEADTIITEFIVGNFGTDTINNLDLKYKINQKPEVSHSWSGSLYPGQIDTLSAAIMVVEVLDFDIKAYTVLTNDTFNSNDTFAKKVYGKPLVDFAAIGIINPTSDCEMDTNETLEISYTNLGQIASTSDFFISYQIIGSQNIYTDTISNSVQAGDTLSHSFSSSINMLVNDDSVFTFKIWISYPTDPIQTNDTTIADILAMSSLETPLINDTTINYGDSVTVTAISNYPIEWYPNDTIANMLQSGSSYTSPQLYDTTTYYVRSTTSVLPSSAIFDMGTMTTTNFSTQNPYSVGGFGATRKQFLFTANELISAGLSEGYLESVSFFIDGALSTPGVLTNVGIYMGSNTNSSTSTSFDANTQLVYQGDLAVDGLWDEHQFSNAFYWDGVSNIILGICHNNAFAPPIKYHTTSFASTTIASGFMANCTTPQGAAGYNRPNIIFKTSSIDGCSSDLVPVVVKVPLPQFDLRVSHIQAPQLNACNSANADVIVGIENMGTDTIPPGFAITYKIDNNPYISQEVVNTSIAPDDTLIYTFNSKANLLANGFNTQKYQLTIKVNSSIDTYSANDSLVSDSIHAHYSPSDPIVSDTSINYGSRAFLSAVANDTVYWFHDSNAAFLLGQGNPFKTDLLYDSAKFYAQQRYNSGTNSYNVGTGSGQNTSTTGPSPYGSTGLGARNQFLIKANDLKALGLSQGYIDTIAFEVSIPITYALNNYYILMKNSNLDSIMFFENNMDTVFYRQNLNVTSNWSRHKLDKPFYWDGISDLVIETRFKNKINNNFAIVKNSNTSYKSTIASFSTNNPNWNADDSLVTERYNKRPNIKLSFNKVGYCKSNSAPLNVNVINFPTIDAGITEVFEPASASSLINTDLKVILKNYGLNDLSSADIVWQENGQVQNTFNWSGNLVHGETDTVTIANHMFYGGITDIKVWTTNPNNSNDTINTNDTASKLINVCMSGTYSIGALNADFNSISEAILNMNTTGICANVIFEIDSGIYNEQILIDNIPGNNSNNGILFKSASSDSTNVNINYSTSQGDNFVVSLKNSKNISFEYLKISSLGNDYANVFVLGENCENIIIKNNIISSSTTNSNQAQASSIFSDNGDLHNLIIANNRFVNSNKAIEIEGTSNNYAQKIEIEANIINDFVKNAIYLQYVDSVNINNNNFYSNNQTLYAIQFSRVNHIESISSNKFVLTSTSYGNALYFSFINQNASSYSLIANNMISINGIGNYKRGAYLYNCNNINMYYNSILIDGGNSSNAALYVSGGQNHNHKNNSFYANIGNALYINTPASILSFDFNNVYTSNSNPDYAYYGNTVADLNALKLSDLSKNQNSISVNPFYSSWHDLHSQGGLLNGAATPIAVVSTDIDGDLRDLNNPDIGADEFEAPAIDVYAVGFASTLETSCDFSANDSVFVKIFNLGSNDVNFSLNNLTIKLFISGINPDTVIHVLSSGVFSSLTDTIIKISNVDLSVEGNYQITFQTSLNGDTILHNNTFDGQSFISLSEINTFPYVENFESSYNFSFKEVFGSHAKVSVSSIAANSSSYGLHFQGGSYANYTNFNNVTTAYQNSNHVAKAYTCNVDASSINSLALQFDLKQTVSNISNLGYSWFRVIITDAQGNPHYAVSNNNDSAFQAFSANSDPFSTHTFDLSQFAGQQITISFESVCKYSYGNGGFDGDNAYIDNIMIWSPSKTDVGITQISNMPNKFNKTGSLQYISVSVQNFGTDTLFIIPVSYSINNSMTFKDTMATMLFPSQSAIHTFYPPMTVLSGDQTVCVYTDLSSDSNYINDTVYFNFKGLDEYSPTFFDDFESTDKWHSIGTNNQWNRGIPNSINVQSAYSGINAWATSLNNNYMPNSYEYLYTPYFKIASSDTAYVEFMQNMNVNVGNAFGILEYSFDGINWIPYGYTNMPNSVNWYNYSSSGVFSWSNNTNGYINSKAPLDPATFNNNNSFQFRFKFRSETSSVTSDGWIIDDFKLIIPTPAKDAKLISIINPDSSTYTGDSISVNILITNLGTDSIYNLNLNYKINNSNIITEIFNNVIAPEDTISYTFNQKYAALNTDYKICAFTSLNNDADNSNDTICKIISSLVSDYDIEVNDILNPVNPVPFVFTDSVTARIINRGKNAVANIPVEFYVKGLASGDHKYDTIFATIAPGDSVDFTFTNWLNPPLGQFNLCVEANLANDNNFSNNSKCVMLYPGSINDLEKYGFEIKQNNPNPFENITKFELISIKATKAIFTVSNIYGQILYSEELQIFSGTNNFEKDFGNLAPGIYFYSFEIEKVVISKKMLIVK